MNQRRVTPKKKPVEHKRPTVTEPIGNAVNVVIENKKVTTGTAVVSQRAFDRVWSKSGWTVVETGSSGAEEAQHINNDGQEG